ncbi:MAG: two-component system, OmpR family, sensor histidine kinase KdpD, partial [Thermodesulfobacteriota bacterium]|nr:two-component system, OmpR family, sensor histidine kinase KdpD [Thermodesulfobacteriota bacterium]
RAERGRLKVYLGYAAGVGKTYQMLQEGHRLQEEGIDVAIGLVETRGRADTAKLIEGLELIPRERRQYRGITTEEMDLEAVLHRKPQVALVDELAHTNVPGTKNSKRYEDVQDILAAGIHVITTLNVQHLESLYDTVEKAVGVKVRERLPDSVLAEADQIVNVDVTAEDLQARLIEGKVYPEERIGMALENFFKTPNLENLRELTLREMAARIDQKRQETLPEDGSAIPDQIMVCLSSRGPNSDMLLRYASRLAGKLNRNWFAVYIQTPSEEATVIDSHTQRIISSTLTLAKELGAMVFTYKGDDIADTIMRFAREYLIGHIVLGSPAPIPIWKRITGRKTIPERLMEELRGVTIVVLDTRPRAPAVPKVLSAVGTEIMVNAPIQAQTPATAVKTLSLGSLLNKDRIRIWDHPIKRAELLEALVAAACGGGQQCEIEPLLQAVRRREVEGSTFFNEGVTFPHARIEGIKKPLAALGLAKKGVTDTETEKPVEFIFLTLTPLEKPEVQIQLLALAARHLQNRHLQQALQEAHNAGEAFRALLAWEESGGSLTKNGETASA